MKFSMKKNESFINEMLINIDDYINKLKQSQKILHKLNYHTKKENFFQNNNNNFNIKEENKTKEKIKLMKKSINKISFINKSPKKSNININKDFINNLNNISYYFNINNNCGPSLTEYNLNNDNNILKPKKCKDIMNRSLSNVLFSMRDERNTNKFIKELHKNKNYNSNKIIHFSFNKDNSEKINDEFFFPLKNKDSNILFYNKQNKSNNFCHNNFNRNKINNYI